MQLFSEFLHQISQVYQSRNPVGRRFNCCHGYVARCLKFPFVVHFFAFVVMRTFVAEIILALHGAWHLLHWLSVLFSVCLKVKKKNWALFYPRSQGSFSRYPVNEVENKYHGCSSLTGQG